MKILQIAPQVPYPLDAGGRIGIFNITKYVAALGHKIDLVMYSQTEGNQEASDVFSEFCTPHFVVADTKDSPVGALLNLFSLVPYNISKYIRPEMLAKVKELILKNDYDVVHIDHLHLAWLSGEIKKIKNIRVVLREHNLEMEIMQRFYENQKNPLIKFYAWMQYQKFRRYEPRLCGMTDTAMMITEVDRDKLLSFDTRLETTVIPAGVTEEFLNQPAGETDPFTLFHVGSLEWIPNYTGLQWFIDRVMPELIKREPRIRLHIYGKAVEKLTIPSDVKNAVIITGYVKDLLAEIADKHMCIVPLSVGGGIRIKVLEMLALSKVVVSTSIGKEGIDASDGKEILVADSAEIFVEKILRVINHPDESQSIRVNAREFILQNYTWSSLAKKFTECYAGKSLKSGAY